MSQLPSVVVLSNCTHASLALALRISGLFSEVESFEVYSMSAETISKTAEALGRFDFILTVQHEARFRELATAAIVARYPNKALTLATPFFSGFTPDMAYFRYKGQIARNPAALGDYHSAAIFLDCRAGRPRAEVVERYLSGASVLDLRPEEIWRESLAELANREADCTVKTTDFIAKAGLDEQIFLTMNHPHEKVISFIARRFATIALGREASVPLLPPSLHNLYNDVYWPTHAVVAEACGLSVPSVSYFKKAQADGAKPISIREVAEASYSFFVEANDVAAFEILTPSYVAARVRSA